MNYNIEDKKNEILKAHGLDFRIIKAATAYIDGTFSVDAKKRVHLGENSGLVSSPYYNLINGKTGEILNSVAKGYTVSQNDEIVEKVLRGIEPFGDQLSVTKAGAIHGGRKVFLQLKVNGTAHVNGDEIVRYVTIIDSNDGSTGLSVGIGNVTMSCQNQFFKFYKKGMRFRHTPSIEGQIKQIPTMVQTAMSLSMKFVDKYNEFQSTKCSRDLAHGLVQEIVGLNRKATEKELSDAHSRTLNRMNELYGHIEHQMSEKGNNLWGMFSGVTRWTTHEKQAPNRENGRIESVMVGSNYKVNEQAFAYVDALI